MPSSDMFGDVVTHDIGLLFESHRFEYRPFAWIKLDCLVSGDSLGTQ